MLPGLMRSHTCGEITKDHIGKSVKLCGWVNKTRDLGGLTFLDVRDKYGLTQLNFLNFKEDETIKGASLESTILVTGKVQARPSDAINKDMTTGEVEVLVEEFKILSAADKDRLPFLPHGKVEATDDHKLKYRYLELRQTKMQNMLKLRSEAAQKAREALYEEGFIEVETPILYKSTPEGARDYIVPSRVHPGKVYALPQSPQTLKQLLMIGGTDKYFQIVKCFRDEDLRADRQPEFSQIDIEVSFATQEYIKALAEKVIQKLFGFDSSFTLPIMSYQEAMEKYGSDKPDTRFGLEHLNCTEEFKDSDFKVFQSIAKANGLVKAIFLPASKGAMARKDIDGLTEVVKPYGGKGVAWFKVKGDDISGGISKFISPELLNYFKGHMDESEGLWLFCGDSSQKHAHQCADAVRKHLGKKFDLYEKDYAFLFVNNFPLLEYDDEEERFVALHHPFTQPNFDQVDTFLNGSKEDLEKITAEAYDVVCNGYEMAGGSVRIFQNPVQQRMFEVLGMSEEEIKSQFGFFVEALKYGTPPHAGIAFGFDRTIMLLAKTDNIRDVIAFPKTTTASDLMSQSPSAPAKAQTDELHFTWSKK